MTTTSAKTDAAGAFALLERVVAERGEDYVYRETDEETSGCLYVHGTGDTATAGCGVGLAATYAGVSLDTLASWDRSDPETIHHVGGEFFTQDALGVLRAFQAYQDCGHPYAYALTAARVTLDKQTAA